MTVEANENIVMFDVDDTLVIWNFPAERKGECVLFNGFGKTELLLPHGPNIKMLKQFKVRGHKVIVWSQGGAQWAAEVVKVLKLEEFVDLVMTKHKWIVDDLPAYMWTQRVYLDLEGKHVRCEDGRVKNNKEDPFMNDCK
jgi:hypothetical protein